MYCITFSDGAGCTSCAAVMDAVVSVVDGSCTACDGAASTTCSAATCASGYHTFSDGTGCISCAAVMNSVVGGMLFTLFAKINEFFQ